jgi:hypothetical protein
VAHGGTGADTFFAAFGAQSSNSIDDYRYGTDRLDLDFGPEETTQALDSNGNGRLDAADDAISVRGGDLTIDLTVLYDDGIDRGTYELTLENYTSIATDDLFVA